MPRRMKKKFGLLGKPTYAWVADSDDGGYARVRNRAHVYPINEAPEYTWDADRSR